MSAKHLRQELCVLARVIYKVGNQQRHTKAYKHLQGIKRFGLKLFDAKSEAAARECLERVIDECDLAATALLFNLRMNYFASFSAVMQASVARCRYLCS